MLGNGPLGVKSTMRASCMGVDIYTMPGIFSAGAEYCDLLIQRMHVRAWHCTSLGDDGGPHYHKQGFGRFRTNPSNRKVVSIANADDAGACLGPRLPVDNIDFLMRIQSNPLFGIYAFLSYGEVSSAR